MGGVSDAIQYLNDLDEFYSAQVRPRYFYLYYILTSYKDGSIFKVLFLFSSDLLFTPSKKNSFSLISDSLSGNARPRFTRSVSSVISYPRTYQG